MVLGEDKKTISTNVATIAAGTDDEIAVFTAPYNCKLISAYLTNGAAVTADATNYTTISIVNKGSDGTGTDEIASFDTDTNGDNISLSALDAKDFGSLSNYTLDAGDTVTLKKADDGTGAALTTANLTVTFESNGAFSRYEG